MFTYSSKRVTSSFFKKMFWMLCLFEMQKELGMNKEGKRIWREAEVRIRFAFLMVSIRKCMKKLEYAGFIAI